MGILGSTNIGGSPLFALVESRLGIDTRALAVFRISLGFVLIADLLLRLRNLRMFYTDDGVLPVSLLVDLSPTYARFSLHAISGTMWFQVLLFAAAMIFAFALLIGYRTRIATAVSMLLLLSLHARNPYLLTGGDALLQHLLFWSLFLPLGERWSIDARHEAEDGERVVTMATAAILIQVLLVYGVNGVLKLRSDPWMTGDAVSVVFGLDRFIVLLGPLLRQLPVILEIANWAWLGLLVASPLLVLSTGRFRIALVGGFATVHLGMLLTMDLGIFPLVSIIALIPFLPSAVWNRLDRNRGMKRVRSVGSRLLTVLSKHLQNGSLGLPDPTGARWSDRIAQGVVAVVLVGIILLNAIALGFVPVPAPADDTLSGEYTDSRWTMFAPHPPTTDRWFVAAGTLASGDRVDPYHGTEIRWERPDTISSVFSSARLRKYTTNLRYNARLQQGFGGYLCNRWNHSHEDELVAVSIFAVEAPSLTLRDGPSERIQLTKVSCNGAS